MTSSTARAAKAGKRLEATPANPVRKEKVTLTGRIATPKKARTKRPVVLQRKQGKKWVRVAKKRTRKNGAFTFKVAMAKKLKKTTVLRVHAPRTTQRPAWRSKKTRVKVVAARGTLALSAARVETGTPVTARVRFTPARPGRKVVLHTGARPAGGAVATGVQDKAGRVTLSVPTTAGVRSLRATTVKHRGAPAVTTAAVGLTVTTPSPDAEPVDSILAAGNRHTCLLTDGTASCWGSNLDGRLGNGQPAGSTTPVPVAGEHVFTALTAGEGHTCALDTGGTAWCWGLNSLDQLGFEDPYQVSVPTQVDVDLTFVDIAAGVLHTCALEAEGTAWCWGRDDAGQIGTSTSTNLVPQPPTQVTGDHTFTSLVAGRSHSCGLEAGGTARCWGRNEDGQLGIGTGGNGDNRLVPTPVVGG